MQELAFCLDFPSHEKNPDPRDKKFPGYPEGKKSRIPGMKIPKLRKIPGIKISRLEKNSEFRGFTENFGDFEKSRKKFTPNPTMILKLKI